MLSSASDCLKKKHRPYPENDRKESTKNQYNKRPVAGPPTVVEMYLAEELILELSQTENSLIS